MHTNDRVRRAAEILYRHDPADITSASNTYKAYCKCATILVSISVNNKITPFHVDQALFETFKHRYLFSRKLIADLAVV